MLSPPPGEHQDRCYQLLTWQQHKQNLNQNFNHISTIFKTKLLYQTQPKHFNYCAPPPKPWQPDGQQASNKTGSLLYLLKVTANPSSNSSENGTNSKFVMELTKQNWITAQRAPMLWPWLLGHNKKEEGTQKKV